MVVQAPLYAKVQLGSLIYDPLLPRLDFNLNSLSISKSAEGVASTFNLVIEDSDGDLLGSIVVDDPIDVWVQKAGAGAWTKYFSGLVADPTTRVPGIGRRLYDVKGFDWSKRPSKRIGNFAKFQARQADGITPDSSDTSTEIGNLVSLVLSDPSAYPTGGPTIVADDGFTLSIDSTGIFIPSYVAVYKPISDILNDLAAQAGRVWWVDENKVFYFANPSALDSGILVTDDPATGAAWGDQTKLAYIVDDKEHKSEDDGNDVVNRLFGLGGTDTNVIDQKSEAIMGGADKLSVSWIAVQFAPTQRTMNYVAAYLQSVGTPTADLNGAVFVDNGGVPGSLLKSFSIPKATPAPGGGWVIIDIGAQTVLIGQKYWLAFALNGVTANTFAWFKGSDSAGVKATSADGKSWTPTSSVATYTYRTYAAPVIVTVGSIPVSGVRKLSESVFTDTNIRDRATMANLITAQVAVSAKVKRVLDATCYIPDVLPKPGQYVTVVSLGAGLNEQFQVTDVTLDFETDKQALGATALNIGGVELV